MKYFKVQTQTLYYDGHGEGEDGGTMLSVTTEKELQGEDLEFILKNDGKTFTEDYDEGYVLEEDFNDEECYAQDGYNYTQDFITYEEISKDVYDNLKVIINTYNTELNNF